MLRVIACSIPLLLVVTAFAGCSKPDPRENPNFNEAAGANPGAVKMEPLKGTKSPGTGT